MSAHVALAFKRQLGLILSTRLNTIIARERNICSQSGDTCAKNAFPSLEGFTHKILAFCHCCVPRLLKTKAQQSYFPHMMSRTVHETTLQEHSKRQNCAHCTFHKLYILQLAGITQLNRYRAPLADEVLSLCYSLTSGSPVVR